MMYRRLSYWGDTTVYKNEKGEVLPEVLKAMLFIKTYEDGSSGEKSKGKWKFDL